MHDVQIGDFVTIAPRAVVLGRVKVSNNVYIGANSTILQDIKIRENLIGAGAVILKYQEIVLLEKYLLNFIIIEIILYLFHHLIVY